MQPSVSARDGWLDKLENSHKSGCWSLTEAKATENSPVARLDYEGPPPHVSQSAAWEVWLYMKDLWYSDFAVWLKAVLRCVDTEPSFSVLQNISLPILIPVTWILNNLKVVKVNLHYQDTVFDTSVCRMMVQREPSSSLLLQAALNYRTNQRTRLFGVKCEDTITLSVSFTITWAPHRFLQWNNNS